MSLSFPTSPANGDTYTDGTRNFTWNGVTWDVSASDAPTNKNYVDSHEPALIGSTQPTVDANSNAIKEGDLWYNTSDGRLYVLYNDGSSTQWVDASPESDTHTFIGSAAPTLTTRPDSSALVNGDMYIDTSTSSIYYYDFASTSWAATAGGGGSSSDTHTFPGTGAPTLTTRPDSTALQNGDLYIDDATGVVFYWYLAGPYWAPLNVTSPDTHSFVVNGVPTLTSRPIGTALQKGDIAIDELTKESYYYDNTTSTWEAISGGAVSSDTHSFVVTGVPSLSTRPDGTALISGDVAIDEATNTIYYYDFSGSSWVETAGGSSGGATVRVGSTGPTTNADGSSPLDNGTQWYDTVSGRTYVWYNDGDSTQWVDSSPSFIDVEKTFVASLTVATGDTDAGNKNVPLGGMYAVGTATSSSDVRVRLV